MSNNQSTVEEVIKQLVLANADGEIKSIAVVFVNGQGEPEIQIGLNYFDTYHIISGLEILKLHILNNLIANGAKPIKDRE